MSDLYEQIHAFICDELTDLDPVEITATTWLPERRQGPDGMPGFLDSLAMAGLLVFTEDEIGRELEDSEQIPENFATIERVVHFIERQGGQHE